MYSNLPINKKPTNILNRIWRTSVPRIVTIRAWLGAYSSYGNTLYFLRVASFSQGRRDGHSVNRQFICLQNKQQGMFCKTVGDIFRICGKALFLIKTVTFCHIRSRDNYNTAVWINIYITCTPQREPGS